MKSYIALAVVALFAISAFSQDLPAPRNKGIARTKPSDQDISFDNNNNEQLTNTAFSFHGGQGINPSSGRARLVLVWFGTFNQEREYQTIVKNFLTSMSGHQWFQIGASYSDEDPNMQSTASWEIAEELSILPSHMGINFVLNEHNIASVIHKAKGLVSTIVNPPFTDTIFVVIAAANVHHSGMMTDDGFCDEWCGYHSRTYDEEGLFYMFIGSPTKCMGSCAAQEETSPNDNPAADATVNTLAHLLTETLSDPTGYEWWDSNTGRENADLCSWTFGTTQELPNGSHYNVEDSEGNKYLIQQNYKLSGSVCALA